jgi:hypothetical protein
MIQPEGTVTYKGNRKSRPGELSFGPDKAVKKAGEFFINGKAVQAETKGKRPGAAETNMSDDHEGEK